MAGRIDLEVKKALTQSKGDRLTAQKELLRAVLADDELLRELVAPFLKPITAQAIDRALREVAGPVPVAAKPLSPEAKAAASKLGAGYNPMKAAKQAEVVAPKRPAASSRHVSTLKLLAAAYQVKRGESV
jgi:hypothetical protein